MTITILAFAVVATQAGDATARGCVVDSVTGAVLQRVLVAVEETSGVLIEF